MKLKYKKVVLGISVGILCIGAITFSVNSNRTNKTSSTASGVTASEAAATASADSLESDDLTLEKNAYDDVNKVIETYFKARTDVDMDTLATVVSDITSYDENQLQNISTYIEGYENIECYTIKGAEENSYFVFVYSDLKLKGVETLAPGLTEVFVSPNEDGDLVIYNGGLNDEETERKAEAEANEDVQDLISNIETKYTEARQSDSELDELCEKLASQAQAGTTTDSDSAEASTEPSASADTSKSE